MRYFRVESFKNGKLIETRLACTTTNIIVAVHYINNDADEARIKEIHKDANSSNNENS